MLLNSNHSNHNKYIFIEANAKLTFRNISIDGFIIKS